MVAAEMPPIQLRVAEYSDEQGMPTKEFTVKTGIAYNTARVLRRGSSTRIDFDTLEKICDMFECEPDDLIVKVDE
jgi:putative transcriptional regulator